MAYLIKEEGLTCGVAFDHYTTSSTRDESGRWHNEYSELGGIIHRLKYTHLPIGDQKNIVSRGLMPKLYPLLDKLRFLDREDLIVCPMPPTESREYQLVFDIAKRVAEYKKKKYYERLIIKKTDLKAKNLPVDKEFPGGVIFCLAAASTWISTDYR